MRGPTKSLVVDAVSRILIPCIFTFAFYILFFGHESPGGGFQSGALLASGVILSRMTLPEKDTLTLMTDKQALQIAVIGVLIYLLTGLFAMFQTGDYLNYSKLFLNLNSSMNHYWGIMIIEVGVTLCVAGTMILMFDTLGEKEE
tara:strand:+ start:20911 stop:21342 length:432 start_codon:yes stop_codon:yes gene_type:complete